MKSIILIAPPAAGKGTQAKLISEKYNLPHVSIGDLIRASLNDDSENSRLLKEQMQSGKLIDDKIIIALLNERLNLDDCKDGYILDGFPRNLNQAYIYDEMLKNEGKTLGHVILLEAPKEITQKRILGRMMCPKCGQIYNKLFEHTKPLNDNLCDKCNLPLVSRDDDNEETFEKRYQTYLLETEPIINYYQEKGVLVKVDSSLDQDYTFKQIETIINGVNDD